MDRFSPVAPAHIRVLVLPVGQIERQRFLSFLDRLQKEACTVRLTDIERYVDDDNLLLSPKAFPKGSILYNYSISAPSPQQEQLSPFEVFREPLVVIGVVDAQGAHNEVNGKELGAGVLRERYPRVVHRQLVILQDGDAPSAQADDGAIRIANAGEQDDAALNDAVCRISARFLKELSTYTSAMQASPSVQTPGQTARSLQRTASQREQEKRPSSGHSTPTQSIEAASPVESSGGSKPPPLERGSPATSFDQITGASGAASHVSRSDSRASNKSKHTRRASSQDRVSVQGFGSGTSQDKLKQRGKARVGIVIGSIYMAAGQWSEALRILVEHTNKARILSDHIWHAKGLENVIVCLLLHSWAGLEFQIPSICYPVSDRSSADKRFSVNLPSDSKPLDAAQLASVRRLSTSLPDLLKLVLSLYRSVEGALELPFVSISEATIRFSKLLAVIHSAGGELDHSTLDQFVGSNASRSATRNLQRTGSLSKAAIVEMLSHAHPAGDDIVPATEQVIILAGIASVYALLQMSRKRANILKDLVAKLTTALTQARKVGAAEAGIHPAASLSADTGAEAILAVAEDSKGVNDMMSEIARVYGARISNTSKESEEAVITEPAFGSDDLKLNILRQFAAFYEASPDPYGVLQMTTAILSSFGPDCALDLGQDRHPGVLSKMDQTGLTATLGRTIGVSKQLGCPDTDTRYWDRYLVRGVDFILPDPNMRVVERNKIKSRPGTAADDTNSTSGNPLLYDPNANRPGTAPVPAESPILVSNEPSLCLITLQNPYEVPVDIQAISLVTEDSELETRHLPFTLQPMRLQQVPLTVFPSIPGDYKISRVRVKISGCAEEAFPIIRKAWSREASMLVKDIGQNISRETASEHVQGSAPEHEMIAVKVVEPQAMLILDDPALQGSSIMLLDGERHVLKVTVRNTSTLALSIFGIVRTQTRQHRRTSSMADKPPSPATEEVPLAGAVVVEANQTQDFEFTVAGKADISRFQVSLMYSGENQSQYARSLNLSINLTVNAALQAQHFSVMPAPEGAADDHFMLSFDLRNAWPRPLTYAICKNGAVAQERSLSPGEIERVYQTLPRVAKSTSANSPKTLARALLETLTVSWKGEGRTGEVDLSGLILSSEEADVVAKPPVNLTLTLHLIGAKRPMSQPATASEQLVKVGSFVTLLVKIATEPTRTNSEPLFLQLQVHHPNSGEGDRTIQPAAVVQGTSHRIVRGDASVGFTICPAMAGSVELEVTARSSGSKMPIARRAVEMNIVC